MKSLSLLTTTVSASLAIWNSTGSIPLSRRVWTSESLIARLALLMSESPGMNTFSKPPELPSLLMSKSTSGWSSLNSSPTAVATGKTVLLPEILMFPDKSISEFPSPLEPSPFDPSPLPSPEPSPLPSLCPPQPARPVRPAVPAPTISFRRVTVSNRDSWSYTITSDGSRPPYEV
jgi:hypothetical protein